MSLSSLRLDAHADVKVQSGALVLPPHLLRQSPPPPWEGHTVLPRGGTPHPRAADGDHRLGCRALQTCPPASLQAAPTLPSRHRFSETSVLVLAPVLLAPPTLGVKEGLKGKGPSLSSYVNVIISAQPKEHIRILHRRSVSNNKTVFAKALKGPGAKDRSMLGEVWRHKESCRK